MALLVQIIDPLICKCGVRQLTPRYSANCSHEDSVIVVVWYWTTLQYLLCPSYKVCLKTPRFAVFWFLCILVSCPFCRPVFHMWIVLLETSAFRCILQIVTMLIQQIFYLLTIVRFETRLWQIGHNFWCISGSGTCRQLVSFYSCNFRVHQLNTRFAIFSPFVSREHCVVTGTMNTNNFCQILCT